MEKDIDNPMDFEEENTGNFENNEVNSEEKAEEAYQDDPMSSNPFPGLRPFKIEESHLFFGREGQSDEVLLKLSENRFVGVIGPSGSGKSSFVYCGVLPILYGGFLTEVSSDWEVVVTRPGAGPIDNLAEALISTDKSYVDADIEEKRVKKTIFSTLLRGSSLGLVESIVQYKKSTKKNYLILVDQFEELFRFKDSRDPSAVDETLAFINLLLEAVNYPDTPIYVALTMRSDFIGECAQFADLTKKINDSHYLIPQMTREQKRKAIEGPVAVGGAEIAPRLVQRLLNDLGDNPDQLPILQHSLMRTWDYWEKYKDTENEELDIKHYEAIGTMSEALSLHANEAYDELNDDQKRICENLFKAITEKRGEHFGIRRPTRLGEIAAISQVKAHEVVEVIDKFRAPGRSLLMPAAGVELTPKTVIDISHESLMRIWVRLKNWVDDESEAVGMYLRLSEAAQMHQSGKAGLWRPPDLQLALNWESKHKPTLVWAQRYHPAFERAMEFLAHSKREFETEQRIKELQAKRTLKRARVTAIVMASLCVVAIGFLLYAFDQKTVADENFQMAMDSTRAAQLERARALSEKEKADSAAVVAKEQEAIAKEQEAIAKEQEAIAKEQEAIAILEAERANSEANRANSEADRATKNADEARRNADEARRNADEAHRNAEQARKEQYQSLAKAIALKSQELRGKDFANLKGALAQQAYLFNIEFDGYKYDGNVYNGLYKALVEFKDPLTTTLVPYKNKGDVFVATTRDNTLFSVSQGGHIWKWVKKGNNYDSVNVTSFQPGLTVGDIEITGNGENLIVSGSKNTRSYTAIYSIKNLNQPPYLLEGLSTAINSSITSIVTLPNNRGMYLLDENGKSILFSDFKSAKPFITPKEKLFDLGINKEGTLLYGVSNQGNLYRWELNNGNKETVIFNSNKPLKSIAVSPYSDMIAMGDEDGLLILISKGRTQRKAGHRSPIEKIGFSFDGNFLATASYDGTVRLWNLNDLLEQSTQLQHEKGKVTSLTYSVDNTTVLAGTTEGTVKFWPTIIEQMSAKMCQWIEENISQEDWDSYIGQDITYNNTCPNLATNNSQEE